MIIYYYAIYMSILHIGGLCKKLKKRAYINAEQKH